MAEQTKHIFVTGGVASSLGKGLTASSLGHLLRSRGLRVTMQKLDPYLNVDPGTMNPFQHGEVFVTDDGAETDLDIGHYERFLDVNLVGSANVTTGQIYYGAIPFVIIQVVMIGVVIAFPQLVMHYKGPVVDASKIEITVPTLNTLNPGLAPQLGAPQLGAPQLGTPQLTAPQLNAPTLPGAPKLGAPVVNP